MATRITAANIDTGAVTADKIAAGAVTSDKVAAGVGGGPKISSIVYPGDDTAALPAGGQTIIINGSGFQSGCSVILEGAAVSVVTFVSATQLQITAPAKATGTYPLYVVNPDGGTAIRVPGLVYSGTPTWTTASGSLGTPYETNAFSVNLSATGDGSLTYALTSGSSLPSGLTLSSAGLLSGTIPATANDTTYTFNVDVTDSENQSTTRQFSVTYKVDVVTWSSPADGSNFSWEQGSVNSNSLSASSAAGKTISFSVQSGSLPANVTIAGNLITGTPSTIQANTAVTVRATAATTARFADRTFYFAVVSSNINRGIFAGGGNTIDYITITSTGNATDFGDLSSNGRDNAGSCSSVTRGVFGGGSDAGGASNIIEYVTIATTGNSIDFGDLTIARYGVAACSSSTRGVFGGGFKVGGPSSDLDYITIASTGNAITFGSLVSGGYGTSSCASPTRGLFGGPGNVIDYITIASTGNATSFGNLVVGRKSLAGCSSSTRGLFGGGDAGSMNQIDYVTIASTGNAVNFGNLTTGREKLGACSSPIRGVFAGGSAGPAFNIIDYVTIASTGNAVDFGDLTVTREALAACSSNHGGLQ